MKVNKLLFFFIFIFKLEVWSISQTVFSELLSNCGIIDGKNFTVSNADVIFYAMNASGKDKKNYVNPDHGLIRY